MYFETPDEDFPDALDIMLAGLAFGDDAVEVSHGAPHE